MMAGSKRIVITGLGCISPLAADVDNTWSAIIAGKSGAKLITAFDTSDISTKFSCSTAHFKPEDYLDKAEIRRNDTFIIQGYCAADQAIKHSGIEVTEENSNRIGVIIGSGIGGIDSIEKSRDQVAANKNRRISPFFIPGSITNMASGLVSIKHNLKGPTFSIVSACTTSTHCIGTGARMIQTGDADCMVVGGSEYAHTKLSMLGFGNARALSVRNDSPETASRPFDVDRDGFVMGDGAAVIILESYEFAKKRGATIIAELAGYGMCSDAFHITQPAASGEGAINCMKLAMNDAQVMPEQIDYINAHGTSTPTGDMVEAKAINAVFPKSVLVSSTKSMTGHLLGAAGSMEAIFSILAVKKNILPPTINVFNQDPKCDIDCIANTSREVSCNYAISNSFGFGGTNGTLVFKKFAG